MKKPLIKMMSFIQSNVTHTLNYRPFDRFLKNYFGDKTIVGCEIGVAQADHSCNLLYHLPKLRLYCIDPWDFYEGYNLYGKKPKKEAMNNLCVYKNRVVIVQGLSNDVINDIPNNLDFVYVDGNHDYEHVKQDIELYYPKVKKGGVLGGHDFVASLSSQINGVPKAVLEFIEKNDYELFGTENDWWIIKS
jgi:hypothetical protein